VRFVIVQAQSPPQGRPAALSRGFQTLGAQQDLAQAL
jgi:hypothetical protein